MIYLCAENPSARATLKFPPISLVPSPFAVNGICSTISNNHAPVTHLHGLSSNAAYCVMRLLTMSTFCSGPNIHRATLKHLHRLSSNAICRITSILSMVTFCSGWDRSSVHQRSCMYTFCDLKQSILSFLQGSVYGHFASSFRGTLAYIISYLGWH